LIDAGYTNLTIADFVLNGNEITANVTSDTTSISMASRNIIGGLKFGNCPNVTDLVLRKNQIVNPAFSGVPNVTFLHLGNNQIVNPAFSGVPNVTQLLLDRNQIVSPAFSGVPNVTELELFSNQIVNPAFSGVPNVTQLLLDDNLITTAGYATMETYANSLNSGGGIFSFQNNTDSILGTNLETILIAKGITVLV